MVLFDLVRVRLPRFLLQLWRRCRRAGQHLNRLDEAAAIEMPDQGNGVPAARTAAATVEELFSQMDPKAVDAAAARTWSNQLGALAAQFDPAARYFVLDAH